MAERSGVLARGARCTEVGFRLVIECEVEGRAERLEGIGAIDVERAAKVSGSRFYYLTGPGALLQLGLLQLAIAQAVESAGMTD